jgi:hypothetical protein
MTECEGRSMERLGELSFRSRLTILGLLVGGGSWLVQLKKHPCKDSGGLDLKWSRCVKELLEAI